MVRVRGRGRTAATTASMALTAVLTVAAPTSAAPASAPVRHAPPAGSARFLWTDDRTNEISTSASFVPPGAQPIVGNFAGDPLQDVADDIVWYTPGPGGDSLWESRANRHFAPHPTSIDGTFIPIVGQFSTDHHEDILWYAPGPAPDALWDFDDDGTVTTRPLRIDGRYQPIIGRFRGVGDDILWYGRGSAPDTLWSFDGDRLTKQTLTIDGTYTPIVGQFGGWGGANQDYKQDIFWYAPGPAPDGIWDF